MKNVWSVLLWLGLPCLAGAQSVSTLMGARASGLANASSCLTDEWSLFNNIGGLAKIQSTTTAFSYDLRPALKSANRMAAVFAQPIKFGVVGVGLFRFGDDLYNEQILSAGFSNQFGLASLGLKLNYIQYHAEGLGTKGVLSISFGGVAQLTPQLSVGAHIVNINQPKISEAENEHIPTLLVAGMGFKPSDKIFMATEIEKDLDYKATWKTGMEYQAHKKVFFRTGFSIYPNAGFGGFRFKPKKFTLDYSFRYEPIVGGSHQASVSYSFKTK